jgi:hypothetical protein
MQIIFKMTNERRKLIEIQILVKSAETDFFIHQSLIKNYNLITLYWKLN